MQSWRTGHIFYFYNEIQFENKTHIQNNIRSFLVSMAQIQPSDYKAPC